MNFVETIRIYGRNKKYDNEQKKGRAIKEKICGYAAYEKLEMKRSEKENFNLKQQQELLFSWIRQM